MTPSNALGRVREYRVRQRATWRARLFELISGEDLSDDTVAEIEGLLRQLNLPLENAARVVSAYEQVVRREADLAEAQREAARASPLYGKARAALDQARTEYEKEHGRAPVVHRGVSNPSPTSKKFAALENAVSVQEQKLTRVSMLETMLDRARSDLSRAEGEVGLTLPDDPVPVFTVDRSRQKERSAKKQALRADGPVEGPIHQIVR